MFLGLLSTKSVAAYRDHVSSAKGYRCAHATCQGGESCSTFIAKLLAQQPELGEAQVRERIAHRLRECKSLSDVRGLSTTKATLKMLGKYGVVGAAAFLASAGVFAATCTTGDGGGGGGCGGGGGSASGDGCEPTLPKADLIEGKVYFAATEGTQVFWDENGNWTKDPGEDGVFVDLDGKYAIKKSAFSTAKLVAETDLLASDRNGFVGGRVMMTASSSDLTRISPFIMLTEISGRPATDVEAVLGLPANAVLRPEQFAADTNVWQTSSVVRTMLARQNEELAEHGQRDVGKALMMHLTTIYSGGTLEATEDTAIRQTSTVRKQRASASIGKISGTSSPNSILLNSASRVPSVNSGWAPVSVSGMEYIWTISIDPNQEPTKYEAVKYVLDELRTYGINSTANGTISNIVRIDNKTIEKLVLRLSSAGIQLDEEELRLSGRYNSSLSNILAERQTKVSEALDNVSVFDSISALGKDPEAWIVMFQTVGYSAQFATGFQAGALDGKAAFAANWAQTRNRVGFVTEVLATALQCGTSGYKAGTAFTESDYLELTNQLMEVMYCGMNGRDVTEFTKIVTAMLKSGTQMSVISAKYGITQAPDEAYEIFASIFELMANITAVSNDTASVRASAIFGWISCGFKAAAAGIRSAERAGSSLQSKISAIEHPFDVAYSDIMRMKWATKLRYRLSKVVREELVFSNSYATTACTTSGFNAFCKLGTSFFQSKKSVANRFSGIEYSRTGTLALPVGTKIIVEYGDGWDTNTDTATAGKNLVGDETISHVYLTDGKYRVTTTTENAGKQYKHITEVLIASKVDTPIPSRPVIQQLTGSAKSGVGLAVNATLGGSTGTTYQSLTAVAEALNANNEVLGTCNLSFNTPSGSFAPGAYFANGCPELNLASAQRVRVSASAVTAGTNQTAKSSVLLPVDKSGTSGVTVSGFQVTQAGDGLPLSGSFTLDGNFALSMVRVHAGRSGESTYYCYLDLSPTLGQKSFTFSGAWANENSKNCASLLPASGGSSSLVFKLEVRDSSGAAVNGVSTPVTATYRSPSATAPVVNQHTPTTASQNQVTTFTYSGSNLVAGLKVSLGGCDSVTDLGGTSTARSFSCTPKSSGAQTLTIKTAANDVTLYSGKVTVAPIGEPITVSGLSASQSSPGQPINGSFTVSGSSVKMVRVHAGVAANDTYCYQDLAASTGAKSFSFSGSWTNENGKTCSSLLPAAGSSSTIVFKVEARDSANNLANAGAPPSVSATYTGTNNPITVSNLVASQSSPGQPINGSFTVSGSSVSLARVHAGTAANDSYCYQDLAASTGAKSFSFSGNWTNENGKTCSSLLPAAGGSSTIVFKVELRDSASNLANGGVPPSVAATYVALPGNPITVSGLAASQSSAGQPIAGSFTVAGSSVSLVRVHAGVAANDTYCYQDLAASTGAKSFSFSGSWANENGKTCSSLLPAPGGSSTIVFKVEARDSANNLANAGVPPTVSATYAISGTPINVSGLAASQSGAGQPINGSFTVSGSSVSMVRVHAGVSANDSYCYQDLAASTGAKSFSFSGSWANENGKTCSSLLPAAGGSSTIVFKVEARDNANNLANAGVAPSVSATYAISGTPINVSGLAASQSSAGQPISGSFTVSGSSVSMVRVHAGVSANDSYCYQDLAASTGAKSFSFSGSWANENGKTCSSLLPAAGGSSTIVFKVEARDSANNLANDGSAPSTAAIFQAQAASAQVTGRSPSTLTRGRATAITVTGTALPTTVVFAIDNVVCQGDYVRTETSVRQTCTAQPGTPSSVGLLVKDRSGGNILPGGNKDFSFTVQ